MFRGLYLSIVVIIFALAVAGGWCCAFRTSVAQRDATEDALGHEARLIHSLVLDDLRAGRAGDAAGKIRGMGTAAGRRVTLVAADGTVLADSEAEPAAMEPHNRRPEIVEAVATGEGVSVRHSDTVGRDLLYYAWRLPEPSGAVLRIAVPVSGLQEHYAMLSRGLLGFAGAALLGAAIVCFIVVRRQTGPLAALTRVSERIA